ncbi:hypothetical protein BDD12DRAFT_870660 [Trichophaea hybrida]|nr:hypothetical protein BDD12DRAFT_870660 [Trichophaea hybrida]
MLIRFRNNTADIPKGYQVYALYTPMIQLSLLSINQIDSAGHMASFGNSKCSISLPSSP